MYKNKFLIKRLFYGMGIVVFMIELQPKML